MRVTRKGQVTVPKALREKFGITTDTPVEFREERERLVLVKTGSARAAQHLRGRLKRLPFGNDVDEYVKIIRGT